VLDAARYLVKTSTLFKDEGIEVSDDWLDSVERNDDEWCEFVQTESNETSVNEDDGSNGTNSSEKSSADNAQ